MYTVMFGIPPLSKTTWSLTYDKKVGDLKTSGTTVSQNAQVCLCVGTGSSQAIGGQLI